MLRNINYFVSDFRNFLMVGWIPDGVSKSDGTGVENNDSISTTVINFVVFIAKIRDRFAKSTSI